MKCTVECFSCRAVLNVEICPDKSGKASKAIVRKADVPEGVDELVLDVDIGDIRACGIKAKVEGNNGDIAWTYLYDMPEITAIEVSFPSIHKTMPGVRKMVIGERVRKINVRNATLPNVKEVASISPWFESGGCLVQHGFYGNTLLNTFCKKPGKIIDLAKVQILGPQCLEGCQSYDILNAAQVKCEDD